MSMSKPPIASSPFKTIFFSISRPKQKLDQIVKVTHEYFDSHKTLLILAPNETAATFIDDLLWKEPLHSFLPHDLVRNDQTPKGPIFIVTTLDNTFKAHSLFNLTEQPIDCSKYEFNTIYEFEDLSTDIKNKSFQNRLNFYKSSKRRIISL